MDATEFIETYRQHLPRVSKYLAYRVHANDVEDLASQIFEIAWQKRAKCPEGQQLAWLYKISGYVVANHRRKVRALALTLYDGDATAPSAESLVMSDLVMAGAWDSLTKQHRAILALFALDQLSISEIALALNISNNAASIRLHRARVAFDSALKEQDRD